LWPRINGINVALYPISTTQNATRYAIPANINGKEADIIVVKIDTYKILGIRYDSGNVFQKGYDKIEEGDVILLLDSQQTLKAPLALTWQPAPQDYVYGLRFTDLASTAHIRPLRVT
ncbi:MAG: hypothetical protein FWF78_02715, partial [Defluviitaleaceae bacterium]|nr:hypothetical protein [Defluviitaleaceae bacterium]